jgi:hypothetical protein
VSRLFDSYIIVDWSAASTKTVGADSIWIGILAPNARFQLVYRDLNPATRAEAEAELRTALDALLKRGDRVLLGFDFPLGYPKGTAQALNLPDANWSDMWSFLAKEMKDKPDNSNNRFQLAAQMNRRISGKAFPFWGCPARDALTTLTVKKTNEHGPDTLAEFRHCEAEAIRQRKGRPSPVWKLAYAGNVGSQALTGIPVVKRLRESYPRAKVWPFETGWQPMTQSTLEDTQLVIAEIYPSIIPVSGEAGEVKDQAQVRELALAFSKYDEAKRFGALFGPPGRTDDTVKGAVEHEEGWILGV